MGELRAWEVKQLESRQLGSAGARTQSQGLPLHHTAPRRKHFVPVVKAWIDKRNYLVSLSSGTFFFPRKKTLICSLIDYTEQQQLTKHQAHLFTLVLRWLFPKPHFYYPEGGYLFKHCHWNEMSAPKATVDHYRHFFSFVNTKIPSAVRAQHDKSQSGDRSSRISMYLITWNLRQTAECLKKSQTARGIPMGTA